jgi:hypothetical protein
MTNNDRLTIEIDKQINAGFTSSEIKQNLLAQNFTAQEIEQGLKQYRAAFGRSPKSSARFGILSVLVSVFFIINGSMRISSTQPGSILHTWGIILLCAGILGVIWKGIDMARR